MMILFNYSSAHTEHIAIDLRETAKVKKYDRVCRENGSIFVPLAFETYGTYSRQTEALIKKIVQKAADVHHYDYSILLNYWHRRFSSTLQYFNAKIINESYLLNFVNDRGFIERDFYNGIYYGFA